MWTGGIHYRPTAVPNSFSLYLGAWTSSWYRSLPQLPHLYRNCEVSFRIGSREGQLCLGINRTASVPVIASAGQVRLGEKPAKDGLVPVRLHEIPPGPVPAQALDPNEIGLGPVLDGNGPVKQIPVPVVEGADLPPLHAGTKEAGGFAGQRQTLLLDRLDTFLPPPAPVDEGILLAVLGIRHIVYDSVVPAALLPGVVADELDHLLAPGPDLPAGRIVVAEFILGRDLVLEGALLVAVGQSRQGPGAQALLLQGQPVPVLVGVLHHCDLRHPMVSQPPVHDGKVRIGMGLLPARVGKEDEVDGNAVPVKADQHGGTVGLMESFP